MISGSKVHYKAKNVPQSHVIPAINEDKEEDSIAGSPKEKCEEKKVNARGEEE